MCRLAWQRPRPPRHASQRHRQVVHYSLGFTAYKAASGGVFFDVGLLGPCEKACRGGRGRCEACL